jgi:hypothetical protein
MMQIVNMFWVVVIFWLCIEVINYRINKNRKSAAEIDDTSHTISSSIEKLFFIPPDLFFSIIIIPYR